MTRNQQDHPRRVMVTGGRKFADETMVDRALRMHVGEGDTLVSGNADGADALSEQWAKARGTAVEEHPADWGRDCDEDCYHKPRERNGRRYCPVAGVARNREMVESGIDLLIAFPGGRGTADATRRAKKAGIEVVEAVTVTA